MQIIKAILFEPVGCLAEFPAEPFLEIAVRFYGKPEQKKNATHSGSRAYWHLLNLMQGQAIPPAVDVFERQAVEAATLYDDVLPALTALKDAGIDLVLASSLSQLAVERFVDKSGLGGALCGVWSRDSAGGLKSAPLTTAIDRLGVDPRHVMFLTDTVQGLHVAESLHVHSILMMNDPDEAMRLAMRKPSGGIVSLHELPDFVRFVAAENARHGARLSTI